MSELEDSRKPHESGKRCDSADELHFDDSGGFFLKSLEIAEMINCCY